MKISLMVCAKIMGCRPKLIYESSYRDRITESTEIPQISQRFDKTSASVPATEVEELETSMKGALDSVEGFRSRSGSVGHEEMMIDAKRRKLPQVLQSLSIDIEGTLPVLMIGLSDGIIHSEGRVSFLCAAEPARTSLRASLCDYHLIYFVKGDPKIPTSTMMIPREIYVTTRNPNVYGLSSLRNHTPFFPQVSPVLSPATPSNKKAHPPKKIRPS